MPARDDCGHGGRASWHRSPWRGPGRSPGCLLRRRAGG
jgi:hypothetical protein